MANYIKFIYCNDIKSLCLFSKKSLLADLHIIRCMHERLLENVFINGCLFHHTCYWHPVNFSQCLVTH